MMNNSIAGMYGAYELVFAGDEAIDKYFEACLENMDADEMFEAWQLYHLCVRDVLEKVFEQVKEGRCEAYFLLYHFSEEEYEALGVGGFGAVAGLADLAGLIERAGETELGGNVADIWFMGQSLTRHKRFLVRYGREIIAKILTRYSALINAAAVWNTQAFRLVKFLGFTVEEKTVRLGMDKSLFKYFYMTGK